MRKQIQKQRTEQIVIPSHVVDTHSVNTHSVNTRSVDEPLSDKSGPVTVRYDHPSSEQISPLLLAAFERTSDATIIIRQDFHIAALNPAARQLLGLKDNREQTEKDDCRTDCRTLLGCQNLNRIRLCGTSSCPLVRVLQHRKVQPGDELILGTEQEHTHETSASVTPVTIGTTSYAILTIRDMSALKVANSIRSNFISMISHELRTPLNSVHGFIDLLLQGQMGEMTDEQRLYLGYTQEGVQQLVAIVEDILFMSRSDLGQFEVKQQQVHLLGLVQQVIHGLQPQATEAEVRLIHDLKDNTLVLFIDAQRIRQVLNNLIMNALKFTPPGGTITVSARRINGLNAQISVADTGYGITPEDRQHIFERFYQSNHRQQSKMGGYGLGLSIAKLIVEQHGGSITFDSTVNKGTTFYFTLPLFNAPRLPEI